MAAELRQVEPVEPGVAPVLIILCGLPGTGKSYFAAALAQRRLCVVVGSDRLRKALVAEPSYTPLEHSRVFAAAHCLLAQLLSEGYRVVFDATNLSQKARRPLYRIAQRAGARLSQVYFDAPPWLVRQRLERRKASLTSQKAGGCGGVNQVSAAGGAAGSPGYIDWSDADWRIYCRMRPHATRPDPPCFGVVAGQDITPVVAEIARVMGGGVN